MFARMVRPLCALPLLLLASAAFAGDNPDIRAFIEFDNDSNYIEPTMYTTFTATIYLENFGAGGGTSGLAFWLDWTFAADLLDVSPRSGGTRDISSPNGKLHHLARVCGPGLVGCAGDDHVARSW